MSQQLTVIALLAAAILLIAYMVQLALSQSKHPTPEVTRRRKVVARANRICSLWRYELLGGFGPLVVVGTLSALSVIGQSNINLFLAIASSAFLRPAFQYWVKLRRRQFCRQVESQNSIVCPDCHTALVESPEGGICAKCGYTFTPESLRQDWADVMIASEGCSLRHQKARERLRRISVWSRYYPVALMYSAAVCLLSAIFMIFASGGSPYCGSAVALVSVPVVVAGLFFWGFEQRTSFFEQLERRNQLICPDCHYLLTGSLEQGRCPECGYTFTLESLARDWGDVEALNTFVRNYNWREP